MSRDLGFILILLVLSISFISLEPDMNCAKAATDDPVVNLSNGLTYKTIQSAIDAPQTLNGHSILVRKGTHNESITVSKSVSVIGEDRNETIINSNEANWSIRVTATNVIIENFTVKNCSYGIYAVHSDNSLFANNKVTNTVDFGIYVLQSSNCTVYGNIVTNNARSGILVTDSSNFTISDNFAYGNEGYGINVNASSNGLIVRNNAFGNHFDGIGLGLGSENCVVVGNNVTDNTPFGIWVDSDSENNKIYHNNIIRNGIQAVTAHTANQWDDGLEGNYWSNYIGADSNNDGISDSQNQIDVNNTDRYPLMGPFSSFVAYKRQEVDVISNSNIDGFVFLKSNCTIKMHVSSVTGGQTSGFCRVRVSHTLMIEPYNVSIDNAAPYYVNYTLKDDGHNRWTYFAYDGSDHEVSVQGVSPPDIFPPTISIISPQSIMYTNSSVPLDFTVDEESSWIGYSLDGKANVTVTGNMTLSELVDEAHDLVVYANDTSGNMGFSDTVHFTIKTEQGWPFLMWVVVGVTAIAIVGTAVFIYLRKARTVKQDKT